MKNTMAAARPAFISLSRSPWGKLGMLLFFVD